VWGSTVARLDDDLHHARDVDHRHDLLERHVAACLSGSGGRRAIDPLVVGAARLLRRPGTSVARVADDVGLSPRELRRRCLTDVGYGPKTLHRVLRFRAVLRELVPGASLADLAARHGYADQSHLGRECRRLAGSSPAGLQALRTRFAR
jgi:AraC-like DNA-binding protein